MGRLPRLALVLLGAFAALPFALYFIPPHVWQPERGAPIERTIELRSFAGEDGSRPTKGMTLGSDGYGTVLSAPSREAVSAQPGMIVSIPSGHIAADVTRFLRGLAVERVSNRPAGGVATCTMEGLPRYEGKVVLVDGCLRFQQAGKREPGPVILGTPVVFRDSDGYLAVGLPDAPLQYSLRVGETDGALYGVGCSLDGPRPAPESIRNQCGVDTVMRFGRIERLPFCSAEALARFEQARRAHAETQDRLRADHEACLARGTAPRACPSPIAPVPFEIASPDCRVPAQSSQGSSTQP